MRDTPQVQAVWPFDTRDDGRIVRMLDGRCYRYVATVPEIPDAATREYVFDNIGGFVDEISKMGAEYWARDGALQVSLRQYDIDIWFSTEGTAPYPTWPAFLDGDLLSARDGIIVARNSVLLPSSVPAGIPSQGVDFGLDAVAAKRLPSRESIHFSTELLYSGIPGFSDGDVLLILNGVISTNDDLIRCFEPATRSLGLDALFIEEPR